MSGHAQSDVAVRYGAANLARWARDRNRACAATLRDQGQPDLAERAERLADEGDALAEAVLDALELRGPREGEVY